MQINNKSKNSQDLELITCPHESLDLTRQDPVEEFIRNETPEVVIIAAAKVGGIYANVNKKSDFYLDNTQINTNVIGEIQEREIQHCVKNLLRR